MKIANIADTHFGCRKNSRYFMDHQKNFFDNYFFPYLEENDINRIVHYGDFFDNRKTVNFETLKHAKDCFINPIVENNIELHMLVGNHDSYFKSNGDLSSTKILFDDIPNINIYDSLREVYFENTSFLMVPWIFPDQKEEISKIIESSNVDVLCGHFDLVGEAMNTNVISSKGLSTDIFSHIPLVLSGHYHKPSKYYIGSPFQMTFNDLNDQKRIIIFDTETNKTESVYLGEDIFFEIIYKDGVDIQDISVYENKIVRVIVKSKKNPEDYEKFIIALEDVAPYDITIKDEFLYVDILNEDEIEETDTLSVLLNSIDEMDFNKGDKVVIKKILEQLYVKASE